MKTYPKISLTGDLGSGKSHLSRLLAETLGFRIVSTGFIQREIATKYGMSTLELNEYTQTHPEIDEEIDQRVTELQDAKESLIFDSRLAWHFAPKSFKVYLTVDVEEAARRIFFDQRTSENYHDITEARNQITARRKSEVERFKRFYDVDYSDFSNYNVVVDTTRAKPEDVCDKILAAFKAWVKQQRKEAKK